MNIASFLFIELFEKSSSIYSFLILQMHVFLLSSFLKPTSFIIIVHSSSICSVVKIVTFFKVFFRVIFDLLGFNISKILYNRYFK